MNEVWKKPPVSLEAYQGMVGKEIGVSSWHLLDQNRIDVYADVIEDHQFIHVDPECAKMETASQHGRARLSDDVADVHHVLRGDAGHRGHDHGRQLRLRQTALPLAGARRFARPRPLHAAEAKLRKPKELQSRTNVTVEIEGEEKPALVADWIGLIYFA